MTDDEIDEWFEVNPDYPRKGLSLRSVELTFRNGVWNATVLEHVAKNVSFHGVDEDLVHVAYATGSTRRAAIVAGIKKWIATR